MKPAVLCINREALTKQGIPETGNHGVFPFDLSLVDENMFSFINREIVDAESGWKMQVGINVPQILIYCVIKCGDKVLSYSRGKLGGEDRLKANRSFGLGGHVDIFDVQHDGDKLYPITTLRHSCMRELQEEVGLQVSLEEVKLNKLIVDQSDSVGGVHVGLLIVVEVNSQDMLEDEREINDPKWLTLEEVKQDQEQYEGWSRITINHLLP